MLCHTITDVFYARRSTFKAVTYTAQPNDIDLSLEYFHCVVVFTTEESNLLTCVIVESRTLCAIKYMRVSEYACSHNRKMRNNAPIYTRTLKKESIGTCHE